MSTSQRVITNAAGERRQVWFVCGWQVKLYDPLITHRPCLSALEMHIHVTVLSFRLELFANVSNASARCVCKLNE